MVLHNLYIFIFVQKWKYMNSSFLNSCHTAEIRLEHLNKVSLKIWGLHHRNSHKIKYN